MPKYAVPVRWAITIRDHFIKSSETDRMGLPVVGILWAGTHRLGNIRYVQRTMSCLKKESAQGEEI